MASSPPSTALLHAVSDWLRNWSDFALVQPVATMVAPVDLDTLVDAPVSEPAAIAAPIGETTHLVGAPPAHWLALLHTHGLTWDATQGITTPEELTVEEPSVIAEVQSEQLTERISEPARSVGPVLFPEGLSGQQERPLEPPRKMPPAPPTVSGNTVEQSQAKSLTVESTATAQGATHAPVVQRSAETSRQLRSVDPSVVEPTPANEAGVIPANAQNGPSSPLVEWLTRLHQGVTALLAATSTNGDLADLPALLDTYAPVAPPPPATGAPPPVAQPATPTNIPPMSLTDRAWTLPPAAPPATGEERPTPLASAPPPATPTPPRFTRLRLRTPAEDRSKDVSLSPEPQEMETPASGKVRVDHLVGQTDLPGRVPGRPAHDQLIRQSETSPLEHAVQRTPPSPATAMRPQPAVPIARLRVQTPGSEQAETVAVMAPAVQPAPTPPLPVPVAAPMPTVLPTPLLPTALMAQAEETHLVTPPDEQTTRLARIEMLLTRLLAERAAAITNTVTPPPSPSVSTSVPPARDRWPTLPERAARAERPPQRRSADPARRRRLEEEQRGRAWNG